MSDAIIQPLSQHKLLGSDDTDEINDFLSATYGCRSSIGPANRQRRAFLEFFSAPFGGITLTSLAWPSGVDGGAPDLDAGYVFGWTYEGATEVHAGNRRSEFDRTQGVVLLPNQPFRFRANEACVHLNLLVPQALIESQYKALTGREIGDTLEFDSPLNFRRKPLASVDRFVRFVIYEVERDESILANPLIRERFSDSLLTTLLYSLPHNYSTHLQPKSPTDEPHYVRRVEEYIDAHCAQAISASDLAEVAGISLSALHAAFTKHRNKTPLEFLKEIRLRRVRDDLLTAAEGTTVKEVARRWGFNHQGRFSQTYSSRYGETPLQTLKRAKAAD